jgi:hypothetical protein
MARRACLLSVVAIALFAAISLLTAMPVPAGAQFFDNGFPFQSRPQREPFGWFEPAPVERATRSRRRAAPRLEGIERLERAAPPADSSKAPAPKKADSEAEAASTPIMVLGDAMADWLAYGLEIAYADSGEIGIVRQARTNSGLIRAQVHNDPEYPDWPQAAREVIAAQHPKFVVMMVGVNDSKQIREQVAPPQPVAKLAPEPAD